MQQTTDTATAMAAKNGGILVISMAIVVIRVSISRKLGVEINLETTIRFITVAPDDMRVKILLFFNFFFFNSHSDWCTLWQINLLQRTE